MVIKGMNLALLKITSLPAGANLPSIRGEEATQGLKYLGLATQWQNPTEMF